MLKVTFVKRLVLARPTIFLGLKRLVKLFLALRAISILSITRSDMLFVKEIVRVPGIVLRVKTLSSRLQSICNNQHTLDKQHLLALASFQNLTGDAGFAKNIFRADRVNELDGSPPALNNLRVFSSKHFSAFGHTAFIDLWTKAIKLGVLEPKETIFFGEREDYANPELLSYFERFFSLKTSRNYTFPEDLLNAASEKLTYIQSPDKKLIWFDDFAAKTQLLWEERNGPTPMVNIRDEHLTHGERVLKKRFDINADDWFVALHLRCSIDPMRNLRDVDVEAYDDAVREIIRWGGRVIRIGGLDYSPKLSVSDDFFIDLSRNIDLDPVTNLYVLARCRFLLGSGSGPANVSGHVFGRPIAVTNVGPMGGRIAWRNQVVLPKMFVNRRTGNVMSIEKRLSDEFSQIESKAALAFRGYEEHRNSASEILELTSDMLSATRGSLFDSSVFMKYKNKQENFLNKCTDNGRLYPVYCANSVLREQNGFC
jgi:putative glycosyltransferase (TIGR04372 family)